MDRQSTQLKARFFGMHWTDSSRNPSILIIPPIICNIRFKWNLVSNLDFTKKKRKKKKKKLLEALALCKSSFCRIAHKQWNTSISPPPPPPLNDISLNQDIMYAIHVYETPQEIYTSPLIRPNTWTCSKCVSNRLIVCCSTVVQWYSPSYGYNSYEGIKVQSIHI